MGKVEQRIVGWGSLAATVVGVLATSQWQALAKPAAVPVWILASVGWLVLVALAALTWSLARTTRYASQLEDEQERAKEVDWSGDLPVLKSDPKQSPLCPKCLSDAPPTYRPVHLFTLNGTEWFECDACKTGRAVKPQVIRSGGAGSGGARRIR